MQDEDALLKNIKELGEPTTEEVASVIGAARAARRRSQKRRTTALSFVAGAALAICIPVAVQIGAEQDSTRESAGADLEPIESPLTRVNRDFIQAQKESGVPCIGGRRTTLDALPAQADVPVFLPDSGQASRRNMSAVWACGGTPVLSFGPINIFFEDGWSKIDLEKKWSDLARDYGGELLTVQGKEVLFQPMPEKGGVSQLLLVQDDVLVRIQADQDVSPNALVGVARSLDFDNPVG